MSETHSAPRTAFLCDQNLGRLARWLRMMGFDAQYMKVWDDERVREAKDEGRIFLTRKRSMAGGTGVVVIAGDHLGEQIKALDEAVGLGDKIQPFSRCSVCNLPLKCAKREDVEKQVPDYVYATHNEFARCPGCSRIYWRGTHPARSLELIRSFIRNGKRG
jgi:uncharacterized protein